MIPSLSTQLPVVYWAFPGVLLAFDVEIPNRRPECSTSCTDLHFRCTCYSNTTLRIRWLKRPLSLPLDVHDMPAGVCNVSAVFWIVLILSSSTRTVYSDTHKPTELHHHKDHAVQVRCRVRRRCYDQWRSATAAWAVLHAVECTVCLKSR